MSMAWVAAGSAVLGTATSLYGANKSAQAQRDAIAANKAAQDETNRLNYQRWLESQGVGANGQPINTWLPRYAMITKPNVEVPSGFGLFSKPKYGAASVGANGVVNGAQMGQMGQMAPSAGGAGPTGDASQGMPSGVGKSPYLDAAGNTVSDGMPYNPYDNN